MSAILKSISIFFALFCLFKIGGFFYVNEYMDYEYKDISGEPYYGSLIGKEITTATKKVIVKGEQYRPLVKEPVYIYSIINPPYYESEQDISAAILPEKTRLKLVRIVQCKNCEGVSSEPVAIARIENSSKFNDLPIYVAISEFL